jgi:hypothetical protein
MRTQVQAGTHAAKPESRGGAHSGLLQRKCSCGNHTLAGGECEECSRNKPILQRASHSRGGKRIEGEGTVPPVVHEVLRSRGEPLDAATRAFMSARFGHDFSRVRTHTDARAADSARAVGARAYAVGQHAVFAAGSYAPHTKSGRRLLAHELAHVVQQEGASAGGVPALAGLRWEPEADAAADAVLSGRNASVIGRTTQPLLAKFSERKTMTDPDGAEVQVDRIINPGKCVSKPETRTSSKKDVTGEQAFLELDFCKGRTGASARGEVNYGEAIDKARTAASNLAQNLASQRPDQALQTFRDELGQISPNAKVETSFQVPGARVGATATGAASGAEGASGQAVVTGAVDFKSLTFRVEYQVDVGTRQETSQQVLVTVGTRDRGKQDRNCFICVCSDPEILFQCHKPPGKSKPPPAPRTPAIVPLFFKYKTTDPREDWIDQYRKALQLAVQHIRDGYTVARIEGNASPEGPEQPKRKGGFNNIDLAQERAVEARSDLQGVISAARAGFGMRGLKNLGDALLASYPVEGKGELFGKAGGKEVSERGMFGHLEKELKAPSEGEPDKLAEAHVTGEGLPSEIGAEVAGQVEEFRTGMRGTQKLSQAERLEAIYRPLRRALIFLKPPPPPKPKPKFLVGRPITPDVAEAAFGEEIDCTEAHMKLFAGSAPPKAEMFTGECTEPGERTFDPGQSKP